MVDVLPTLLGLAQLPIDRRMAGCDLSAELLLGTPPQGRTDVIATHGGKDLMLRTQQWKYLRWQRGDDVSEVLYDLGTEPEEFTNRAADPGCRSVLAECRERALHRMIDATRSVLCHGRKF